MAILKENIEGKKITIEIKSSNLQSAFYETDTEDLTVTFNNGSIYVYNKVPWNVFTKFRMADSQGKFFNESIGRTYKFTKVK
jgi:hypothetical protein